jgi:hypothetical protein
MVSNKNKTYKKNKSHKHKKTQKVFDEKDYSSNDGMLVTVWGPPAWHMLHTISFNYPVNPTASDKKHYRDFILGLRYTLPCGKCRKNLIKNMKKLPLTMGEMKSRETFSRYMYNLHEAVNKMTNKKSGLSYEDVRERYEHFRARCTTPLDKKENQIPESKPETGCVVPLYGEKSKCVLNIIPQSKKCKSLIIDKKCIKHRLVPHTEKTNQ